MTTKDDFLFLKDFKNGKSFVNNKNKQKYSNLNLNQGYCSSADIVHSYNKSNNNNNNKKFGKKKTDIAAILWIQRAFQNLIQRILYKFKNIFIRFMLAFNVFSVKIGISVDCSSHFLKVDSKLTNNEISPNLNKSTNVSSKSFNFSNLNDKSENQWKPKKDIKISNSVISKNNNNSTLSLHISAYENSVIEAAANLDSKNAKQIFSTFLITNPFEFPRQQNEIQGATPEMMQFKATQQLQNPNQLNAASNEQGNQKMVLEVAKIDQNLQQQQKCCNCHQSNTWRILLRNCSHMICVFCGIEYIRQWIQEKDKARIKCPKKSCRIRIHENDIKALLDSENRGLDMFLGLPQREWLQFKHDKDIIGYALGAPKFAKQCPLCMNYYAKIDGCNFVRCSNLRCNQWFCFCCGDPVSSWQHFSQGGQCRVSWDDVYKLTYLLRFIVFSDPCTNFLMIPMVWLAIWIFLPLFSLIGFPFFSLRSILRLQCAASIPMAILASPFILAISVLLFFGTFLTAFPLYFLYIIISVIKCIPPATHIFKVLDYAAKFAGMFGFGNWKQILMDSRDARMELEVEDMQIEIEKSERIPTIERNSQQQAEYDAAELAREARKDRAVGAAQCAGGAVDVGRLIKKGAHNVEVVRKGEIQKIQLVGFNDVKVNDPQAVAENIKIKGKAGKVAKFAAIV